MSNKKKNQKKRRKGGGRKTFLEKTKVTYKDRK